MTFHKHILAHIFVWENSGNIFTLQWGTGKYPTSEMSSCKHFQTRKTMKSTSASRPLREKATCLLPSHSSATNPCLQPKENGRAPMMHVPILYDPKHWGIWALVLIHSLTRTISETEDLDYMGQKGTVETGMSVWPPKSLERYTQVFNHGTKASTWCDRKSIITFFLM